MPFCTRRKAPWTNFNTLLYTAQSPLNQLQCVFAHVQSPLNRLQGLFVHDAKPLELTSRHFCTRAKPSCKRSKTFCTRCKTPWTNFKALLFIVQNRHANVQVPFDHDANRLEATSKPFCSSCKTVMQTFKYLLITMRTGLKQLQSPFVHHAKPSCKCSVPLFMIHLPIRSHEHGDERKNYWLQYWWRIQVQTEHRGKDCDTVKIQWLSQRSLHSRQHNI